MTIVDQEQAAPMREGLPGISYPWVQIHVHKTGWSKYIQLEEDGPVQVQHWLLEESGHLFVTPEPIETHSAGVSEALMREVDNLNADLAHIAARLQTLTADIEQEKGGGDA